MSFRRSWADAPRSVRYTSVFMSSLPFLRPHDPHHGPQFLGNVWTMHKGNLTLVCVLRTHPLGWELRLTPDDQFIRTQVCKEHVEILDLSETWRAEAEAKGWTRPFS